MFSPSSALLWEEEENGIQLFSDVCHSVQCELFSCKVVVVGHSDLWTNSVAAPSPAKNDRSKDIVASGTSVAITKNRVPGN